MADTAALTSILGINNINGLTGGTLTNFNTIVAALDAGTITMDDVQTQYNTVVSQYYNGLDRAPDEGGMLFWVNGLLNNGLSAANMTAGFDSSTEGQVVDLYHSLLGRARDDGGLTFWVNAIDNNGQSIDTLRNSFLGSSEYTETVQPKFGENGVENFIYGVLPNQTYTAQDGQQDLFLIDEANVDGAVLTGFNLAEGDILKTGSSVASLAFSEGADGSTTITVTKTGGTTETVTIQGVAATNITSSNVSDYFLGASTEDTSGFTFVEPAAPLTPTGAARTFTYTLGTVVNAPIEFSAVMSDPLDSFFYGHDKIAIVDTAGQPVSISGDVHVYTADVSTFDGSDVTIPFRFAVFNLLGFGNPNATGAEGLTPLQAGEVGLVTYTPSGGEAQTYLFVDTGPAGTGSSMDNGAGSATWQLDQDVLVNLTGILNADLTSGTTLSASELFL